MRTLITTRTIRAVVTMRNTGRAVILTPQVKPSIAEPTRRGLQETALAVADLTLEALSVVSSDGVPVAADLAGEVVLAGGAPGYAWPAHEGVEGG